VTVAAIKPKTREDLAVVELDGEAVIYDEESSNLHHLNSTATLIFDLCDGTATIKEFAAEIADAYGQPREEVERQVRAVIRQFRTAGLLEAKGSAQRNGSGG
jgi:PqqD family protein of HPr-rel-A system